MNKDWKAVFNALFDVYYNEAYSNLAINEALRESPDSSAGFVRVLTKGVIRDSILIDYNIDRLTKNGIKSINKKVILILRMGFYAISKMDSVPGYAAVNEAVNLTKNLKYGSEGFVNAVLRGFIREGALLLVPEKLEYLEQLSYKYSFPYHLVRFLDKQYGKNKIEGILAGLYDIPELCVRTNLTKISREELITLLSEENVLAHKDNETSSGVIIDSGNIINTYLFNNGYFTVQSSSSIKSIEKLAAEQGDKVLDICAAPGGKTTGIAELMKDTGEVIATDIHKHRIELIKENAKRLELKSIKAKSADALILNKQFINKFDKVLADVPCSGLGVIASKPEIKLRVNLNDFPDLYRIQSEILRNAFQYLKPDGVMIYSTCTINKKENEKIIEEFVKTHENARVLEYKNILPYNKQVGFYYCKIQKYNNL